jgi:hypothetical protein
LTIRVYLRCAFPNVRASDLSRRAPPQSERDYASDTRLENQARVSKPIEITDRGVLVLSLISGEENIHPAHASLHDVMRNLERLKRLAFACFLVPHA